jgi:hypothetical protein
MGLLGCVESGKGTRIETEGARVDAQDYKVQELREIAISEDV